MNDLVTQPNGEVGPEYAVKLQQARNGFAALVWAHEHGELDGFMTDIASMVDISAEVYGQIMMEMLEDTDAMLPGVKQRLVLVAEHMGPDWIETLRKAAAFMDKVESFR